MNEGSARLLTGNEAAVMGAIDAGATFMFGYPITPATEILEGWIKAALERKREHSSKRNHQELHYLQTEDEIAAGFAVLGAVLAGERAFTASAGPGHILLQDPVSMAENLRLPYLGIMMQRGGPSTGTVNFSQQEVNLAIFGGNGDGLRIVYSASSVEEMYELVIEAFGAAWQYRFPTIVLGDGYLGKMEATIDRSKIIRRPANQKSKLKNNPILQESIKEPLHLRNCYSSEEQLAEVLADNIVDWRRAAPKIARSENFLVADAEILVIAHGIVAAAARQAVLDLRADGKKVGLFRPITLNPLDAKALRGALSRVKRAVIIESSLNQFSRLIKYESFGIAVEIIEIPKPAEGFTAEEIIDHIEGYVT